MRRMSLLATVSALALAVPLLLQATPGTFRGVIISGPEQTPGWIYVRGANGMTRRVGISRAHVEYADSIPASKRAKMPESAIATGVEVRVTAELTEGEWRASRVEILRLKADGPPIEPAERSDNIRSTP